MDQSKIRGANRFRKTPRKPGTTNVESRSVTPTPSPTPNNLLGMPNMWDFSNFNPFLSSMLNGGSQDAINAQFQAPSSVLYSSSPSTPMSDLMSFSSFSNFQNKYVPLSRSRTSSFLPSDTSDSSRRGSDDYAPATRSYSSAAVERPNRMSELSDYFIEGKSKLSRSTSAMSSKPLSKQAATLLPLWALDGAGNLRLRLPIGKVLDSGELDKFVIDKNGCQYLQDALKKPLTIYQKLQLFDQIIGKKEDFIKFSTNMFGNFLVQQVIEMAMQTHDDEYLRRQERIKEYIGSQMTELCLDKSACRVVQFALENIDLTLACALVQALPCDCRLIAICVDQNANHVIQKVVSVIPLQKWEFIIDFISLPDHLRQICSDKYGCRVVQTIIEKLTADSMNLDLTLAAQTQRERALRRLMNAVTSRCSELATNEYANYIIQHIVSSDDLAVYRECIIEKCLMRNLLSLSQEKFASHVVEKAFLKAPLELLAEMMDEIFDGYVPHPDTGKDALDIMMFHQFGNYVVQCMLTICCDAVTGRRNTKEGSYDHIKSFHEWLKKLQYRISKERHRLSRFSSGKKMIETLANLRHTHPYFSLSGTGHHNFNFEGFSTASEDEFDNLDRKVVEKSRMMLKPRFGDLSTKMSPSAHDGDDEGGTFPY